MARISIFGMGYVGCVSAACLARDGHEITGVDISAAKLHALRNGLSPVGEPGLDRLIAAATASGRLRVESDVGTAISQTDLSMICVGTPSRANGSLDLRHVAAVAEEIGTALAARPAGHVVCVRSTMLPGTLQAVVRPALERGCGRAEGEHFHLVVNPEFLREGSAIRDYDQPPKIVIGARSDPAAAVIRELYGKLQAPLFVVDPEVAELVKCVDNTWHATKIAFANEVGELSREAGVDSHELIEIFLADRQLNVSPAYLKPGFAFGGSCLPKDVRALSYFARQHDLELPLLQNVLSSNNRIIEGILQRILERGVRRLALYGLSFKPDTDDLRESPLVRLVEMLIGKGIDIRILDEYIQVDKLTGANKQYIEQHIPHFVKLLVESFETLASDVELLIIGHRTRAIEKWSEQRDPGLPVLDLARIPGLVGAPNVEGISW